MVVAETIRTPHTIRIRAIAEVDDLQNIPARRGARCVELSTWRPRFRAPRDSFPILVSQTPGTSGCRLWIIKLEAKTAGLRLVIEVGAWLAILKGLWFASARVV